MINNILLHKNKSSGYNLIQGPLAGFSCAPFRQSFNEYDKPLYTVSEMISAHDVLYKHKPNSRYLYRAPDEQNLCYQIAGNDHIIMARAANRLEKLGADLIDINCGCPKNKIRKKGAGSALLDAPNTIYEIVHAVKESISIPLTVKMRLVDNERDITIAQKIQAAGADAIIVHGRHWIDDYDIACDYQRIKQIKQSVSIPIIANGDISCKQSLDKAITETGCDAFMISRAGTGNPWLYQQLLYPDKSLNITFANKLHHFMSHLNGLEKLENGNKAILQSRKLVRYYFKGYLDRHDLLGFYQQNTLMDAEKFLMKLQASTQK